MNMEGDLETLKQTLDEILHQVKSAQGRSRLASSEILIPQLLQLLSSPNPNTIIVFKTVKALCNLCAGEISNQSSFLRSNGGKILLSVLRSTGLDSAPLDGVDVVRVGLRLLANVVLAGEEYCCSVWDEYFPSGFIDLARVRRAEVCDPLCRILHVCCERNERLFGEMCGDKGIKITGEIIKTASMAGFQEDVFPLLVSRICFRGQNFFQLFSVLNMPQSSINDNTFDCEDNLFTTDQAFLLSLLSDILNQRRHGILGFSKDFALDVFEILKKASASIDFSSRCHSELPTGSTSIDVLGYSLNILRDICAYEIPENQSLLCPVGKQGGSGRDASTSTSIVIGSLVCSGLVAWLLCLLRRLEPPEIIRKCKANEENQGDVCLYLGYRRDLVSILGNCTFRRKNVQDDIRQRNGVLLLLQQCVTDKENPFLREWGIFVIRNLLEGNAENKQKVADLELQTSVDTPDLTSLGLRVELDKKSGRPKLVNIS